MIKQFIEGHKFAVAHNNIDYFVLCELDNQEITTGQPFLELFDTQEEAIDKFGDRLNLESNELEYLEGVDSEVFLEENEGVI